MIKIAFFLPSDAVGGAEKFTIRLANAFAEDPNYDITMIFADFSRKNNHNFSKKLKIIDLKSQRVLMSIFPLITSLRFIKPDIIISAMEHANSIVFLAKKFSGIRSLHVSTVHTNVSRYFAKLSKFSRVFQYCIVKACYNNSYVVSVSLGVLQATNNFFDKDICDVMIYNQLDSDSIIENSRAEIDAHEQIYFSKGSTFIAVGRLTHAKDYASLIKAFHSIKDKPDLKLIIIGEGELRGELESLVIRLGEDKKIFLIGQRDNPYKYMAKADVYVLSSAWEGLPTSLIEALILGLPVVSTDCNYGPREILTKESHKFLAIPGDVEDLSSKMREAIGGGPTAEPEDLNRYNMTSVKKQYEAIWKERLKSGQ